MPTNLELRIELLEQHNNELDADNKRLQKQHADLHKVLGRMLRIASDPDPLHPSWVQVRQDATTVWHTCNAQT